MDKQQCATEKRVIVTVQQKVLRGRTVVSVNRSIMEILKTISCATVSFCLTVPTKS